MFQAYGSKCFSISLYLCSFHVPFTSLHVHFMCLWFLCPVILEKNQNVSVNHIFVLRSPYLISLISFCSFMSLWCSSDFSFSVCLLFFLIFLSCPFHFTLLSLQFPSFCPSSHSIFLIIVCPIIFEKSSRISAHVRFKLCSWSLVLFMIFLAHLCIRVPIHYVIMCSSFKAV